MPFRKSYKRKPKRRVKKILKRGRLSIPRGLSPAIMNFKRSRHEIITVGTAGNGWLISTGSTGMYKTFAFTLGDLNDNSDFVNLFRYYKINAVAVKIWPCNTYTGENAYTGQFSNSQLICRWDRNQDGTTGGAESQYNYADSQTAKQRRLINGQGKPLSMLMRLKQSNMIFKNTTALTSAYTLMRPKWHILYT